MQSGENKLAYTVVIRTLGTAAEKYQRELDSLMAQTMPPEEIIVYIAEGYPIPKETCGKERYVYVKKGMVAQRALPFDEVKTEWMLFLDDDVYLPPTGVETLFRELQENNGDVIAPCVFENHKSGWKTKLARSLTGREVCRLFGGKWAYKVLPTAGFSYNNNPKKGVYLSQTNAGPCFLCRKKDFLDIKYEEELWLDETPYAFPDDQVMFYKMYLSGLKLLTSFDSGITHLDASSVMSCLPEKELKLIYSEYRNKYIFWHKFFYERERGLSKRLWIKLMFGYFINIQKIKYLISKTNRERMYRMGIDDGRAYIIQRMSIQGNDQK